MALEADIGIPSTLITTDVSSPLIFCRAPTPRIRSVVLAIPMLVITSTPGVWRRASSRLYRRRSSASSPEMTFTLKGKSLACSSVRRAVTFISGKTTISSSCDPT